MDFVLGSSFNGIIQELVILSAAPAKIFRPASFAGRAGAESKDPFIDIVPSRVRRFRSASA